MNYKANFSSFKTLAVLVLVSMAFLPRKAGQLVMAGLVAAWLLYHGYDKYRQTVQRMYIRMKARLKHWTAKGRNLWDKWLKANSVQSPSSTAPVNAKPMVIPEISDDYKQVLMRHINARITEKLQAGYPEASWSWIEDSPIDIAAVGGTGRIRTASTDRYNHAEVTFETCGNIHLKMLEIAELPKAVPGPAGTPKAMNLAGWYEVNASNVVRAAIDEVYCRGYKNLHLNESGELYIINNGAHDIQGKISLMPGKQFWKDLVPLFAADEIKASVRNSEIELKWN